MSMQDFDALPGEVRRALHETAFNFDEVTLLQRIYGSGEPIPRVIAWIKTTDRMVRDAAENDIIRGQADQ